MRFIIVNLSHVRGEPYYCTYCVANLEEQYLRELDTRLVYCDDNCLRNHTFSAIKFLEDKKGAK